MITATGSIVLAAPAELGVFVETWWYKVVKNLRYKVAKNLRYTPHSPRRQGKTLRPKPCGKKALEGKPASECTIPFTIYLLIGN